VRGVLNVKKPTGISSYDVIRRLKGVLSGRQRIGHAGTLDPIASGVLLVLFNEATRIGRFLLGSNKEYEAEVLFGTRTDTDDTTGDTVEQKDPSELDRARVAALLPGFRGEIEQVPPRFSALKQDGTPLYRLARQGVDVEPKTRKVTIHGLELVEWTPPRARIRALVSSGTYIRALARDIGEAAGTGATLSGLTRTRSGTFDISGATPLDHVTADNIEELLVPIDKATPLPCIPVPDETARRMLNGQEVPDTGSCKTGPLLATADHGRYLAVAVCRDGMLKQQRLVFADW
jgi:tRNA pseudouridine55 synthase